MAGISTSTSTSARQQGTANPNSYGPALLSLMVLFFMMGFITCLNDILIPFLKNAFSLNYAQSMLVQFCFFGAYFVVSIPSGILIQKVGYKKGMIIGFIGAGVGCLLFLPAAATQTYEVFLAALFILASGITLLQVSANPYVAVLGPPETSSSRLTLTQAFNSVGTTIAPTFGSSVILTAMIKAEGGAQLTAEQIQSNLSALRMPYIGLAAVLFIIALVLVVMKLPVIKAESSDAKGSAWQYRHLVLGAVGIFAYVGAEVAIGSLLINFIKEAVGLPEEEAGHFLSYYWGGAMVGRFIGTMVLRQFKPGYVLGFNALIAALLVSVAIVSGGTVAMWALIAVGFFNSIMFATIFTLAVAGLGSHTEEGSGILCTAIVGGAIIPAVQGAMIDNMIAAGIPGLQYSFVLPVICYLYIVWYGVKGHVPKEK